MVELILYIIVFIVLSGLLAMVDAAILSISRAEVEEMVLHKKWGAFPLRTVKDRVTRGLVIIVIVTNTINVLGPILVGQKAIELYGSKVIGAIAAILAFGTIIFSEIIPKSLGAHYAPFISRLAAPFIVLLIYALYPLVILLDFVSNLFKVGKRRIGTEDQIRSLVTIGRREGYIESDEGQLIHRAFILNDKTAEDIMTPLKDLAGIKEKATVQEAANKLFHKEYSRYPVFGRSIHDVKGIIMSRDILEALTERMDQEPVTSILRKGLVVSSDKRSDELLVLFRDRHIHLAVVQKKGKTIGVVTLEDVLEELVGEIEDEKDARPSHLI